MRKFRFVTIPLFAIVLIALFTYAINLLSEKSEITNFIGLLIIVAEFGSWQFIFKFIKFLSK